MEIKNSTMGAIYPTKSLDEQNEQGLKNTIVGTKNPEELEKDFQNVLKSIGNMAQAVLKMNGGLKYVQICSPKDIIIEYNAEDGEKKILNKYGEEICTLKDTKNGYQIIKDGELAGEIHNFDNNTVVMDKYGDIKGQTRKLKDGGFQAAYKDSMIMEYHPDFLTDEKNVILNKYGTIVEKGVDKETAKELGEIMLAACVATDKNNK